MNTKDMTTTYTGLGVVIENGVAVSHCELHVPPGAVGVVTLSRLSRAGSLISAGAEVLREQMAAVPADAWAAVVEAVGDDFARRLKHLKAVSATLCPGVNKLDRIMGIELCVLFDSITQAQSIFEINTVLARWLRMEPDQRWALFHARATIPPAPDSKSAPWVFKYPPLLTKVAPARKSRKKALA